MSLAKLPRQGPPQHAPAPPLLETVQALRAAVAIDGAARLRKWRPTLRRSEFAASALNLAHYLALRHRDLRPLQRELMRHGVSSLGRLEGRVLVTLDAVSGVLAGGEPGWPPSERRFFRGEARLHRNAEVLFGRAPSKREVRILVTLGREAAEDPNHLLQLARCGADAVRINCAHDDSAAWTAMLTHTRAAERATGRYLKVLMDIAGPKIRTGEVRRPDDDTRLTAGRALLLVPDAALIAQPGPHEFRAVCLPPQVLKRLAPGAPVAMDDGKLSGEVETCLPDGSVLVRVQSTRLKGVKLKPEKGLNFPGTELGLDPLTERDLTDLDFIAQNADLIGYSFVQSERDIARLQSELAARRPQDWTKIGLIAKIETLAAVHNLPEIIVRAAGRQPFGVMIARGDLAVEIGFARLAEMQEELLWLCEAAQVPVVWATQVLEQLVTSGLPTRGEMTDAAMAARAECVMLNKGPNLGAAITALDGLLRRMAEHQSKKTSRLRALRSW
jgi:pyruvate kinase